MSTVVEASHGILPHVANIDRKALERWESKIANTEVTPQAILPIAKSLMKRDGPKAPTAIRGLLGFIFHPLEKALQCLQNKVGTRRIA
jgi:hypothetical protein